MPAELGVEAVGEGGEDIVGGCPVDGVDELRIRRLRADVAGTDRPTGQELESREILEPCRQVLPPGLDAEGSDVDAVGEDPACCGLVHPREELHQRRLARAVLADDCHCRPGWEHQVDVSKHRSGGTWIGETDAVETDPVTEHRGRRLGLGHLEGQMRAGGVVAEPHEPPHGPQ